VTTGFDFFFAVQWVMRSIFGPFGQPHPEKVFHGGDVQGPAPEHFRADARGGESDVDQLTAVDDFSHGRRDGLKSVSRRHPFSFFDVGDGRRSAYPSPGLFEVLDGGFKGM